MDLLDPGRRTSDVVRLRSVVLLACVLASIGAASETSARSSAAEAPPPDLRPTPGWVVSRHGAALRYIGPSSIAAATSADAQMVRPFMPFGGFKRLSPRGIILWATTLGRHKLRSFRLVAWPPRLSKFRVDKGWEGQPAANIQQRLLWGSTGGWDMDVRVYFATQHPDQALLRKAQAELNRLVLPAPRGASLTVRPAPFATRPGWHTGHSPSAACPGVAPSRCVAAHSWAATVPWRDCGECLPHKTIAALPPDGIALQLSLSVEQPRVAGRQIRWPPTIRARDVVAGFEGISSRYGVYQLPGRVGRKEVYAWAFFGRAHPTRAQLAAANAELATAEVVTHPRTTRALVATNGVSVSARCAGLTVRTRTGEHHVGDLVRVATRDGLLRVSVSRSGCALSTVSVELLNAHPGAWLDLGPPDIYPVGRLSIGCTHGKVASRFRLDSGTATASLRLEPTLYTTELQLQPGQTRNAPPLSPHGIKALAWTISPGGEAGSTTAYIIEGARRHCRVDLRALITPFRTGG